MKFEKSSLGTGAKIKIGEDGSYMHETKVIEILWYTQLSQQNIFVYLYLKYI